MKVLHFLRTGGFSGAENVVCQIIRMMEDQNIDFIYSSPDGIIRDILKEQNICFKPIKTHSLISYKQIIKETQPNIIHAHDMGAAFCVALQCGNIPLIIHIHNNAFNSRKFSMKSLLFRYAANKAKYIFWVSETSLHGYRYHHKYEDKSIILYNIIDINSLYEKMYEDKCTYSYDIVYVGRLTYQKNPERLIAILKQVVKRLPYVKAALIGIGDLELEIDELIRKNNLCNHIIRYGFLNNPYKIIYDSKIMLMSSRWEGTPMSCLESLALGTPIISTPVDGIQKIIVDSFNGYLSEDDDVLVEKIICTLTDENLLAQLSKNAKQKSIEMNDKIAYKKVILDKYLECL